jgi:iron(III) transport system permease protein
VSGISGSLARVALGLALLVVVGWPAIATVREASRAWVLDQQTLPASGSSLDLAGSTNLLRDSGGLARPLRLAAETVGLVVATEAIALPVGIVLALFLFRTDAWGRRVLLALIGLSAFVPLPLHATAWLGALGNAGRAQALGVRPILVGRLGAAFVHGLANQPWVVLIVGVGLCAVEPELEESALLDYGPVRVLLRVTLRRSLGAIAAAALAVAVLTAGDMTVTDLLMIRTYAEEAFLQYSLGRGPGGAALVAIPPLVVLGLLVLIVGRALERVDPARLLSSFSRARLWQLGRWRIASGVVLVVLAGNLAALPVYSLVWRAGRVGGRAMMNRAPTWSLSGLVGTLRYAGAEIWEPLLASLLWTAIAATLTILLAGGLAWASRRSLGWRSVALCTLALTLATPGPVAGMALVLAYRGLRVVYDSPAMVVMAEIFRSLPYAILIIWPFIRSFPQEHLEAAALDGLTPWGQLARVVIPLSRRALVAAWAIAFAIGLGELPATNLVVPPGTQPMSVVIWGLLHTGVESHLAGVALITLIIMAAAGLCAAVAVRSLRAIGWP